MSQNCNLSSKTTERFVRKVLSLAYEIVGVLGPWDQPYDEDIIAVWNLVFKDEYPIISGDVKEDLFLAVKGLIRHSISYLLIVCLLSFAQVKRGISTWLYKFAMAAEKALISEFKCQDITTVEDKATFVWFLLGDADDFLSKNRPFLWKSAYDRPENSESSGPIRLQVCYAHLLALFIVTNHISF